MALRFVSLVSLLLVSAFVAGCGEEDPDTTADPNACDMQGSFRACALPGDSANAPTGGQQCSPNAAGDLVWTACEVASSAASTPLVLSFDGAHVAFVANERGFDINGTMSVATDWPTAKTPWLALDRNHDGAINSGAELFGSATTLASGDLAQNGFQALAELDDNHDGRITPADTSWSALRVWSDKNEDRTSTQNELSSLDASRLLAIELRYTENRLCDTRGNCEVEKAMFVFEDESGTPRTGAVIDVHLRHR
jgi:hypothetical protein